MCWKHAQYVRIVSVRVLGWAQDTLYNYSSSSNLQGLLFFFFFKLYSSPPSWKLFWDVYSWIRPSTVPPEDWYSLDRVQPNKTSILCPKVLKTNLIHEQKIIYHYFIIHSNLHCIFINNTNPSILYRWLISIWCCHEFLSNQ